MKQWVVLCCLLGLCVAQAPGKCRVLALAGGGDKGAYQAGAIQGLIASLPAGEAEWDVITGVGIGAVNALPASRFAKGSETAMSAYLNSFWKNFSNDQFYVNWPGLVVQGLLSESGLYNSAPMLKTLNTLSGAGASFGRHLVVGATDLMSGDYIVVNDTYSLSDVVMATYGTASMTGTFPPVTLDSYYLADGTLKFSVDILSGVNQCLDMGFQRTDVIVDVVLCTSKNLAQINLAGYKPLQVLIRYLEIESYDDSMQVLENAKIDYPGVDIRSVIVPSTALPEQQASLPLPYSFSEDALTTMLELGYSDALAAGHKVRFS
jgi:predicted patatin/cPLA2 family phospholipase